MAPTYFWSLYSGTSLNKTDFSTLSVCLGVKWVVIGDVLSTVLSLSLSQSTYLCPGCGLYLIDISKAPLLTIWYCNVTNTVILHSEKLGSRFIILSIHMWKWSVICVAPSLLTFTFSYDQMCIYLWTIYLPYCHMATLPSVLPWSTYTRQNKTCENANSFLLTYIDLTRCSIISLMVYISIDRTHKNGNRGISVLMGT